MKNNEEMSQIEKLLDENNNDNIILFNENNVETEFEQIAVIPLEDCIYFILKPVQPIEGVQEDEALVFVLEETEDEDMIVICDDEETINKVFEEYYSLLKEEGLIDSF